MVAVVVRQCLLYPRLMMYDLVIGGPSHLLLSLVIHLGRAIVDRHLTGLPVDEVRQQDQI
jgi:hypothetical protein